MSKAAELAALIGSGQAQGNKNLVQNGSMAVSQRATSSTGLGAASGYFTLDRFIMSINSASAGRYTMSQSDVTDLEGFSNALKIQCTTADTSIAAGEVLILSQRIEGQNIQTLKSNSTSSKAFTISFYAKSNESRAISLEARFSNGTNRQAATVHTIGTSWARYTMTVAAASSIQIDNDNSNEMQINFFLHAGSDFSSGTIQGSTLGAADNTKRAAGIGSIFASTDNFIEITGLQMEVGEVATPFEHEDIGTTLAKCQRYFETVEWNGYVVFGNSYTTTQWLLQQIIWKVEKRVAPTLTYPTIGTSSNEIGITDDTANYVTQGSTIRGFITTTGAAAYNNNADGYSGLTDDSICSLYSNGATTLKVDAEL
jgi:hypothetical protein